MTLQDAPASMMPLYASSSGATSPGFTDLRPRRSSMRSPQPSWIDAEDVHRPHACWLATLSLPPTSVYVVPDWGPFLIRGAEQGPTSFSPADQLKAISKTFSLSKVELAKVLGVSRQTIYDWLDGRPMSHENEDRVLRLAQLAWDFGGKDGQTLLRRLVAEPLRSGEPSILMLLLAHPWNETRLRRALGEARARTERKKTGSASAWLRSLGFSEPGPAEKAANLGQNVPLDELSR